MPNLEAVARDFWVQEVSPMLEAQYDETHLDGQVEADADCIRISTRGGGDLLDNRGLTRERCGELVEVSATFGQLRYVYDHAKRSTHVAKKTKDCNGHTRHRSRAEGNRCIP